MKHAAQNLKDAAVVFEQRNAVYKNNIEPAGKILAILKEFGGMRLETEEDFRRYHIFALIVVKLTRYTNNWNPVKTKLDEDSSGAEIEMVGHYDSLRDLTVYAAMLESIDREINEAQVPF